MTKSHLTKSTATSKAKKISFSGLKLVDLDLTNSLATLRIIGYGLISLWLLDILAILHPLQPFDPMWGFEILGQLVERVGVLLIGLGLILIGDVQHRQKWELSLLKIITTMVLIMAIAYFSLIPLGIGNTVRIVRLTDEQISLQAQSQIRQLIDYHSQVEASSNILEVQQFIAQIGAIPPKKLGNFSNAAPQLTLAELKQQAGDSFRTQIQEIKSQSQLTIEQRKTNLIKRSLKWNLGALLSGLILLLLWENNRWMTKVNRRSK